MASQVAQVSDSIKLEMPLLKYEMPHFSLSLSLSLFCFSDFPFRNPLALLA
jgi:hypothetical protein